MDKQKLFGKRIKELRKLNKLTQEQVSEMLGVFQKQIGNIETGVTFTTMNNLEKLAETFNVEIKDLFDFEHKKERIQIENEIVSLIKNASDKDISLIYRLINSVLK